MNWMFFRKEVFSTTKTHDEIIKSMLEFCVESKKENEDALSYWSEVKQNVFEKPYLLIEHGDYFLITAYKHNGGERKPTNERYPGLRNPLLLYIGKINSEKSVELFILPNIGILLFLVLVLLECVIEIISGNLTSSSMIFLICLLIGVGIINMMPCKDVIEKVEEALKH